MKLWLFILLTALVVSACSRRAEYPTPTQFALSPDALNINTATATDLERLPHVGKKTAESIVEFRTDNGPFRRPEQVMLIRGLSERRFVELRPYLKVE